MILKCSELILKFQTFIETLLINYGELKWFMIMKLILLIIFRVCRIWKKVRILLIIATNKLKIILKKSLKKKIKIISKMLMILF